VTMTQGTEGAVSRVLECYLACQVTFPISLHSFWNYFS